MKTVTVRRDELLTELISNRERHRALFEKAVDAYYEQAVRLLNEHIGRIRAGRVEVVHVVLPKPEDHTDDYSRVIRMVEMSVDDAIELTQDEFAAYVQDDWSWKRQFLNSTQMYLGE